MERKENPLQGMWKFRIIPILLEPFCNKSHSLTKEDRVDTLILE